MRKCCVLVAVFAGACHDYQLVAPAGNVAPAFAVDVQVWQTDTVRVDVYGSLSYGTDAEGYAKSFADPTPYVDNARLSPSYEDAQSIRFQTRARLYTTPPQPDSLQIRPPRLLSGDSSFTFTIPIVAREDPMDVIVANGSDLHLHLSPLPDVSLQATRTALYWSLQLHRSTCFNTKLLSVESNQPNPAELVIPSAWLPATGRDSLVACLLSFEGYRAVAAPYPMVASVNTFAMWRIHIQ
jgi:hypothetical protein